MQAIIINKIGDHGVLKIKNIDEPKPKKDEVLVRHTAIGVNFFDVSFRRGQYPLKAMPAILGMEACGVIEAIGPNVTNFRVGERVAYATGGIGAYAEKRVINQHHLVIPPSSLSDVQVAGVLMKGLMTHALLHRVYIATRAKRILVHAAAGGIGHILCQWARHLGLEIIGTVGSDEKISFAKMNGCNHVINYKKQDLVNEVANITGSAGVGLVYDGVGKDVINKSLQCLWPMGTYISFGESSGNTDAFNLNLLVTNSLYITRPTLALYKSNRIELSLSADEVFSAVEKGIVKPQIKTYAFKDVDRAHKDLEGCNSMGSLVLTF